MCASPTGFGLHIEMNERSSKEFSRERLLRKLNSFTTLFQVGRPQPFRDLACPDCAAYRMVLRGGIKEVIRGGLSKRIRLDKVK